MAKHIHLAAVLIILSMVFADAFHIGVGKIGRRKKRTFKIGGELQEALQDLCLFNSKHCNDAVSNEPQSPDVLLMYARKIQERNVQKTLKIVCEASTNVCKSAVQRSKRSATLLWPQEKKHRRPMYRDIYVTMRR